MTARRMYALRLGEVLPHRDLNVLRGIEGARVKESYAIWAQRIGIDWQGRRYDRTAPMGADLPNQALNHAASAVEAAAAIAVCATSTIHEDPGQSSVLDIADLYRDTITIACAFKAAKQVIDTPTENIERVTCRLTGGELAKRKIVPDMIERIKALIEGRD